MRYTFFQDLVKLRSQVVVLVLSGKKCDLVQTCATQLSKLRETEKIPICFFRHSDCWSIRTETLKQTQNKVIVIIMRKTEVSVELVASGGSRGDPRPPYFG